MMKKIILPTIILPSGCVRTVSYSPFHSLAALSSGALRCPTSRGVLQSGSCTLTLFSRRIESAPKPRRQDRKAETLVRITRALEESGKSFPPGLSLRPSDRESSNNRYHCGFAQ